MAKRAAPNTPTKMVVGERGLAFAVYVLYLLGYITGITAIIGVVIAYIQADSANAPVKSHYTFQVRTFVIGLIYFSRRSSSFTSCCWILDYIVGACVVARAKRERIIGAKPQRPHREA
jgi:hypothetical protein